MAYAQTYREPIYVDAGDKQFMVMPSQNTRATAAQINDDWNQEFARRLGANESMQQASAGAARTVAQKYDMAYYEGKDGLLDRVP